MDPDPLAVTCPRCRAPMGEPCSGSDSPHPARVLAASAVARMPAAKTEPNAEQKATKAARLRQRARARDPRMNNDW